MLLVADCVVPESELEEIHGWGPFGAGTVRSLGLRVQVEMYQCVEIRGRYSLRWSEIPQPSRSFTNPGDAMRNCGRDSWQSPLWPASVPRSEARFAKTVQLGNFKAEVSAPDGLDAGKLQTPVTGWSAPPGWSMNLHELLGHHYHAWVDEVLSAPSASYYFGFYGESSTRYNYYDYYDGTYYGGNYNSMRRRYEPRRRATYRRRYSGRGANIETYYTTVAQKNRSHPVGIMRAKFFKTNLHVPTQKDEGLSLELRIIRVGLNDDGYISKWSPPWFCPGEHRQNHMLFMQEGRDYEQDTAFYWRYSQLFDEGHYYIWVDPAVYYWSAFFFLVSGCSGSCRIGAICAAADERPPLCGGCLVCCSLFTGLAQFLLILGILNLMVLGPEVLGVILTIGGCLAAGLATCLGCKYANEPAELNLSRPDSLDKLEAVPLGRPTALSELD